MSAIQSKNLILNFALLLDKKIYISLGAEVLKDGIKLAICASSLRRLAYKFAYCCYENDEPKNLEKILYIPINL